jgi:hypothetical protein
MVWTVFLADPAKRRLGKICDCGALRAPHKILYEI